MEALLASVVTAAVAAVVELVVKEVLASLRRRATATAAA